MKLAPLALLLPVATLAATQLASSKDRTITQVVKLLQSMMDKSKEDGDTESTLYTKFKCYCDTTETEKTDSIDGLQKKVSKLENGIDKLMASNTVLSIEVAELTKEMDETKASLEKAEEVRTKENEAFLTEETNLGEAIDQLGQAITALSEIGADQASSKGARDHTKFMAGHEVKLLKLNARVKEALLAASAYMRKGPALAVKSFLQEPFTATYSAQSGEIFGILKDMKSTFEANLEQAKRRESTAAESHLKFKETSNKALATLTTSHEGKAGILSSNDGSLGSKKTEITTAKASLADDEAFLSTLQTQCADKAKEYSTRLLLRKNEEVAISEAIAILNSDAAFETFGTVAATKTGATAAFLQLSSSSISDVRSQQAQVMLRQKKSARLAKVAGLLAAHNPMAVVLAEIEKILTIISEEGSADQKQHDWCTGERTTNNANLGHKNVNILALDGDISALVTHIEEPETGLQAQITTTEALLQTNSGNQIEQTQARTEENMEYRKNIRNYNQAESLLAKAIKVLKTYYAKLEASQLELIQDDPAPPATWSQYGGQSAKGGDAVTMLEFILENTQKENAEAHAGEKTAQHEYEDSMTTLTTAQATAQTSLTALNSELADKKLELLEKRADKKTTKAEAAAISKYLEDIKPGCDFIVTNIGDRKTSREEETFELLKARDILKGSPAYVNAEALSHNEALGDCLSTCAGDEEHVKCKACLADVTVVAYCAGHGETSGCSTN